MPTFKHAGILLPNVMSHNTTKRRSKRSSHATGNMNKDTAAVPNTVKPLPGQLQLDLKPAINPDWPEPSTKLFDADQEEH